MLDIREINAGYGNRVVLEKISLCVEAGTLLALIGPNGSGKTTFIRAASGILPLISGRVMLLGRDISRMNTRERAQAIAVVPQSRTLPPAFSTFEVVSLGRTPYQDWFGRLTGNDAEIIQRVLDQTDLAELADRKVSELSGGEQQRLFLARALVQESPLLLLDEPTTHLDLQYQVNLLKRVHRLAHPTCVELSAGMQKKAVVLAMHDLNLVSLFADLVALLVNGKLVALGPPAEILRAELLSDAYQIPLRVIQDQVSGASLVAPEASPEGL